MNNDKEFTFTRKHFDSLRKIAQNHAGIQVSDEKYDMYYARLTKRLRNLHLDSFEKYIQLVKFDEKEFMAFINAITTNVTAFDRELHHFQYLKEQVQKQRPNRLRIWSAGCSSGLSLRGSPASAKPIPSTPSFSPRGTTRASPAHTTPTA